MREAPATNGAIARTRPMKRPTRIVDAAAALEEALDLLEPLLRDLHARAVADQEVAPEPAARACTT